MTRKQEVQLNKILTTAHHDYAKYLNSYAFFKVHDYATSEDLVQDTFMKTWKYLVNNGKIDAMKAFLFHVLNNLIVDEYRKKKTTSLDVLIEKGFEPSVDDLDRHLNIMDGKTAITLIRLLPEKYRKVMQMRYIKMLSLKEISLITRKTKNTIAVQAHRGLEKLKLLYSPI